MADVTAFTRKPTTNTAEKQLRVDLAAAFRLAAHFDWHEAVANHFSLAVSPDGKSVFACDLVKKAIWKLELSSRTLSLFADQPHIESHLHGDWLRNPTPEALLNASIFFDFRALHGDIHLANDLRAWLVGEVAGRPAFLRMMAASALKVMPPLGRIRDFVVDEDGTIDMKKSGARLFVDVARILALRTGVESSSTVQRLRQGSTKIGGMSPEEVSAIIDGFNFIQLLRLRSQHLETEHDSAEDNRIDPESLNELDRRILKEAFRQARKLQLRLKLDYQL